MVIISSPIYLVLRGPHPELPAQAPFFLVSSLQLFFGRQILYIKHFELALFPLSLLFPRWLNGHARYHIWRIYPVSWKPLSNTFSWALWCKHCLKWIEVPIFFVDFYDVSPSCFTIWICALLFASPLLHCSGIGRSWQSFRQCYCPKRRWAKQLICEHRRQICKSWSYKTSRRRANRGENNFAKKPFSSTFMTSLRQHFNASDIILKTFCMLIKLEPSPITKSSA